MIRVKVGDRVVSTGGVLADFADPDDMEPEFQVPPETPGMVTEVSEHGEFKVRFDGQDDAIGWFWPEGGFRVLDGGGR